MVVEMIKDALKRKSRELMKMFRKRVVNLCPDVDAMIYDVKMLGRVV